MIILGCKSSAQENEVLGRLYPRYEPSFKIPLKFDRLVCVTEKLGHFNIKKKFFCLLG